MSLPVLSFDFFLTPTLKQLYHKHGPLRTTVFSFPVNTSLRNAQLIHVSHELYAYNLHNRSWVKPLCMRSSRRVLKRVWLTKLKSQQTRFQSRASSVTVKSEGRQTKQCWIKNMHPRRQYKYVCDDIWVDPISGMYIIYPYFYRDTKPSIFAIGFINSC